ncbi:hypothetical protein D1871_08155 [Nakamurella silvestris]|nr:hypothetical protein D1871_08155 [Nakamurella silvestris]
MAAGWLRTAGVAAGLSVMQAFLSGLGAFGILLFNDNLYGDLEVPDGEIWSVLACLVVVIALLVAGAVRITDAVFLWTILGSVLSLAVSGYFLIRVPDAGTLDAWPYVFAVLPLLTLVVVVVLRTLPTYPGRLRPTR